MKVASLRGYSLRICVCASTALSYEYVFEKIKNIRTQKSIYPKIYFWEIFYWDLLKCCSQPGDTTNVNLENVVSWKDGLFRKPVN